MAKKTNNTNNTNDSIEIKTIEFGFDSKEVPVSNTNPGYSESKHEDGQKESAHNPMRGEFFKGLTTSCVTSIPSPYARMHVTEIAFRKLEETGKADGDFKKAISHCLDLYEMFFHWDELSLPDKDIDIDRVEIITKNNPAHKKYLEGEEQSSEDHFKKDESDSNLKNLSTFVDTLDGFRKVYMDNIERKKNEANGKAQRYCFDFTQMYVFKRGKRIFAGTSPFTGFFAKGNCDLTEVGLSVDSADSGKHKLLTNNPDDWLLFEGRSKEFLEFLYLLLRDSGLQYIFDHLYNSLKKYYDQNPVSETVSCPDGNFDEKYPAFNLLKADALPKISGKQAFFIRVNRADRSYLKYLLFLANVKKPVDISIPEEDYKPIGERKFGGQDCNWVAVRDLLSEGLFILPYDVNSNYYAISYPSPSKDEKGKTENRRRCLVPLKREALDYLGIKDFSTLEDILRITEHDPNHYSVKLKVKLFGGGEVWLRRDYYTVKDSDGNYNKNCLYPNGILQNLQNSDRYFAFGIYPFVKSKDYENIYKVLLYHDYDETVNMSFFYSVANGGYDAYKTEHNVCVSNYTGKKGSVEGDKINNIYYHLHKKETGCGLEFAEMSIEIRNQESLDLEPVPCTALILPKYRDVNSNPGEVRIAIDLGTSNTYIAYQDLGDDSEEGKKIKKINTQHVDKDGNRWSEFVLMNEPWPDSDDFKDVYPGADVADLFLSLSDVDKKFNADGLPAQMCEFIPSRIGGESTFKFPIPTLINKVRKNGKKNQDSKRRTPLIDFSIPFAYYNFGSRGSRFDGISDKDFKWFFTYDDNGDFVENPENSSNFKSFIEELLFIVRCHMLSSGYELKDCKLLWTYPLSFTNKMFEKYKEQWEIAYCRYFQPDWLSEDSGKEYVDKEKFPKDENEGVIKNISLMCQCTSESLSPLYAIRKNKAESKVFNILMDVGGGSTDIIGYGAGNEPSFLTSFTFAGNALYLQGSLNSRDDDKSTNYMYCALKKPGSKLTVNQHSFAGEQASEGKITINSPITTIMNYGFSKIKDFGDMFKNMQIPQFMLRFHNAALFYHTAQLCKHKSPKEVPSKIYLSGNGSKLFRLNEKVQSLAQTMFLAVYGDDFKEACGEITLAYAPEAKAATAEGALRGYDDLFARSIGGEDDQNGDGQPMFRSENFMCRMVGDKENVFRNEIQPEERKTFILEKVKENVDAFIDAFFEWYPEKELGKINLDKDKLKKDKKFQPHEGFDEDLNRSMFFAYVSVFMENMSIELSDRI